MSRFLRYHILVVMLGLCCDFHKAWSDDHVHDLSGVVYREGVLQMVGNKFSEGFFKVAFPLEDVESNILIENVPMPETVAHNFISCSEEKRDIESIEIIGEQLLFLDERCATLLFPNGKRISYYDLSHPGLELKIKDYHFNRRLEGLSVIKHDSENSYLVAVSVEGGLDNINKPPFIVIHLLDNLAPETDLNAPGNYSIIDFPVDILLDQDNDLRLHACQIRVTEVDWLDDTNIVALVKTDPAGACWKHTYICSLELNNSDGLYSLYKTICEPLSADDKITEINWEGIDRIDNNRFLLVADSKPENYKKSFFIYTDQ